jgi:hypothetical protein
MNKDLLSEEAYEILEEIRYEVYSRIINPEQEEPQAKEFLKELNVFLGDYDATCKAGLTDQDAEAVGELMFWAKGQLEELEEA